MTHYEVANSFDRNGKQLIATRHFIHSFIHWPCRERIFGLDFCVCVCVCVFAGKPGALLLLLLLLLLLSSKVFFFSNSRLVWRFVTSHVRRALSLSDRRRITLPLKKKTNKQTKKKERVIHSIEETAENINTSI